jgi:hypothetical protein
MAVRLSALLTDHHLPPGRFLALISVRDLGRPQGHSAAEKIRSTGKSSELIGNRTRDLPGCGIMPQLTTLSHAPTNIDNVPKSKYDALERF